MPPSNHEPKKEKQTKKDALPTLEKVSEIARRALKKLIQAEKPALPPLYEKAFYNIAIDVGESELVNHLMSKLPTGQAATIMAEELHLMIASLTQELSNYRQGLDQHSGSLENTQSNIKAKVDPETWEIIETNLSGILQANLQMKKQLEQTENRLQDQEKQVAHLQRKTRLDPLTGAMNRHAMEEDIAEEFARSKRYKRVFSLIMADIDFFKKINDTHGHAMGDEVLKTFVKLMHKSLREVDIVYRYGGEEFMILLPETPLEGGHIAAERVRKCIEEHVLRHRTDEAVQIKITVSLGVATFNNGDSGYQNLVERADKALYHAKENGRNRVELEES